MGEWEIRTMVVSVLVMGLMAMLVVPGLGVQSKKPVVFCVSPKGNDDATGTLAAPFATVARARNAVRELRKRDGEIRPPTICLRSGTYYLAETLTLTPEDSHLTVRSYEKEQATLSGGRPISGFRPMEIDGGKLWAVHLPQVESAKWYFRSLYDGEKSLSRTRLPKTGYYRVANPPPDNTPLNVTSDQFHFNEGEMSSSWVNPGDIDAVVLHFWEQSRMPLVRVDDPSRTAFFGKKSVFRLTDDFTPAGARYYVENVFEALDTPGQWYLNRKTAMLYYMPRSDEDISKTTMIAPALERLVSIQGDEKRRVENVSFEGIRFAHTDWSMPANRSGFEQASWGVPGAVCFIRAKDCSIRKCELSRIGSYAIQVADGCAGIEISANNIHDLGAGAVKIERGSVRTSVTDNEIHDGGKIFHSAVGVLIMDSGHNRVAHNHIHDFDYSGVSAGWCWSYDANAAAANVIEYNHIHDIGRSALSDMACIYTLGPQPGTVIRNNLVHDCVANTYGGWGIYLDAASSYMLVENNIAYRNKSGAFHQPTGRENTLHNNIFALNKEAQIVREKAEDHLSLTFEHNIVYWDQGVLLGKDWSGDRFRFDENLYWKVGGGDALFGKDTLDQWRERGQDIHSLIADPRFRAPEKGDFTLMPGSPASKIGFKAIDLSKVGPRKKPR